MKETNGSSVFFFSTHIFSNIFPFTWTNHYVLKSSLNAGHSLWSMNYPDLLRCFSNIIVETYQKSNEMRYKSETLYWVNVWNFKNTRDSLLNAWQIIQPASPINSFRKHCQNGNVSWWDLYSVSVTHLQHVYTHNSPNFRFI